MLELTAARVPMWLGAMLIGAAFLVAASDGNAIAWAWLALAAMLMLFALHFLDKELLKVSAEAKLKEQWRTLALEAASRRNASVFVEQDVMRDMEAFVRRAEGLSSLAARPPLLGSVHELVRFAERWRDEWRPTYSLSDAARIALIDGAPDEDLSSDAPHLPAGRRDLTNNEIALVFAGMAGGELRDYARAAEMYLTEDDGDPSAFSKPFVLLSRDTLAVIQQRINYLDGAVGNLTEEIVIDSLRGGEVVVEDPEPPVPMVEERLLDEANARIRELEERLDHVMLGVAAIKGEA